MKQNCGPMNCKTQILDLMKTPLITQEAPNSPICLETDDSRKLASSDNTVDEVVKDTVRMLRLGIQSTKKGWQSILIGALLLNWLRMEHSAQGKRNDLVANEKKSGFNLVLIELNLVPATAYRWIDRAMEFVVEIGISNGNFPCPGSNEWARMEKYVRSRVDMLGVLKLPIRAIAVPQDEEIMTRLRAAAEVGDQLASQLLVDLDSGDTSIEDAAKQYCRVEKVGNRPEPAMLQLDSKTLKPKGLLMKALDTLENGFRDWDEFPPEVKIQARQRIREVFANMPKECNFIEP